MDDLSSSKAEFLFSDKHKDEEKPPDSDSDTDSGGPSVYPEVLASFPFRPKFDEFEDTSLDHYIPCFVERRPGMKPFLIDIKVTKNRNYSTQRDFRTNGGSFRDFNNSQCNSSNTRRISQQYEGSFRDINNSYSTNSNTSYARQFGTKEGSFRDYSNSYSTNNTGSYVKEHNFGTEQGYFRDFNNPYSTNSNSSYARQRDFGTIEGSFRDYKNCSYPNASRSTPSYTRERDFTTNGGSFRDVNNSLTNITANITTSSYGKERELRINEGPFRDFDDSGADFGSNSHGGSWSFNPEEIRAASSYQQVRSGNNYRNNSGNNYRNNYGNNYRNNNYYGNNNNNNYNTNTSNIRNNNNNYSNKFHRNNNLLTRGPRSVKGQKNSTVQKEEYNKKDFIVNYEKARFFMIKSFSENDVFNSVKYNVWSSTPYGNKKLDSVYRETRAALNAECQGGNCPIFLFFSVNSSSQFVGMAEMTGLVDFEKKMDFWQQDRWNGFFPVKWHIIKDIPNFRFRDITLENNENKVVTFSRDTQEILLPQGLKMLEIFKEFEAESSLLDDFEFYEEKEKERWENKNEASGCNDDLFDDFSMDSLEEELRRINFQGPKRYY